MAQKIQITSTGVKRFLNRYTPEKAVAEYIWNGFDAGATNVSIEWDANEIGTLSELRIIDNGGGIDHARLNVKFKPFLDSEKFISAKVQKQTSTQHGKNGVGRLTFHKFATGAEWQTVYKDAKNQQLSSYTITASAERIDQYDTTQVSEIKNGKAGTRVIITGIHSLTESMLQDTVKEYLKREFCWFLELHKEKEVTLKLQGEPLDYSDFILEHEDFNLSYEDTKTDFAVRFVQWADNLNEEYSKFYYLASNGSEKFKEFTSLNKKGDAFYHSVYVKGAYFDHFDVRIKEESAQQTLEGLHSRRDDEYKYLRKELAKYLRKKRSPYLEEYSEKLIVEYERDGVMPSFDKNDELESLKKNNLEQTVKTLYQVEPKLFTQLNLEQKKTFIRFIDLALESGQREGLFEILKEVIELDEDERKKLSTILGNIKLSNILKTITLLDDRKATIEDLEKLVFNKSLNANEVDHLQKVVETNFWIFGEQYTLVTAAEPKFKEALERQWQLLETKAGAPEITVEHHDAKSEMDIFLCREKIHQTSEVDSYLENVVIELKSPAVSLGKKQLDQVTKYLRVIKNTPQFNGSNHKWTFILVGNAFSKAVDENSPYIQDQIDKFKSIGTGVADHDEKNGYVVYAKTWSTIFSEFKLRHDFIYKKLNIERKDIERELNDELAATAQDIVISTKERSSAIDDNEQWQSKEGVQKLKDRFLARKV